MINTHLSPYDNDVIQGREKRVVQVKQIIDNVGCDWDLALLGLDMNDVPNSELMKLSNSRERKVSTNVI